MQHHGTFGPLHEQAQIDPNDQLARSTPGTISSLFSIISSPAASIKPLLVSRSTTQYSGVVGIYLPMTSKIARSNATNLSADCKMVFHVKLLTALRTLSHLVRYFRKTVLLSLYPDTDSSQISDLKCLVEYQRTNLLCSRHPSSLDRVCYQRCERDSEPTAHNLQIANIKSITPMPMSRRDRIQPLKSDERRYY